MDIGHLRALSNGWMDVDPTLKYYNMHINNCCRPIIKYVIVNVYKIYFLIINVYKIYMYF